MISTPTLPTISLTNLAGNAAASTATNPAAPIDAFATLADALALAGKAAPLPAGDEAVLPATKPAQTADFQAMLTRSTLPQGASAQPMAPAIVQQATPAPLVAGLTFPPASAQAAMPSGLATKSFATAAPGQVVQSATATQVVRTGNATPRPGKTLPVTAAASTASMVVRVVAGADLDPVQGEPVEQTSNDDVPATAPTLDAPIQAIALPLLTLPPIASAPARPVKPAGNGAGIVPSQAPLAPPLPQTVSPELAARLPASPSQASRAQPVTSATPASAATALTLAPLSTESPAAPLAPVTTEAASAPSIVQRAILTPVTDMPSNTVVTASVRIALPVANTITATRPPVDQVQPQPIAASPTPVAAQPEQVAIAAGIVNDPNAGSVRPTARQPLAPTRQAGPAAADPARPRRTAVVTEPTQPTLVAPLVIPTAPAGSNRSAAAVTVPAPASTPDRIDFGTLVDTIARAREQAAPLTAAVPVAVSLAHADFGPVALRFRHDGDALSVTMASADPGFAPAVAAATSADASARAGQQQQQPSDTRRDHATGQQQQQASTAQGNSGSGTQGQPQQRSEPRFQPAARVAANPSRSQADQSGRDEPDIFA